MSTYGPRALHGAAPVSDIGVTSGSAIARTAFDAPNGPSRLLGAADSQIALTQGAVRGRIGSQHSVSSGINSYGPLIEDGPSLGSSKQWKID